MLYECRRQSEQDTDVNFFSSSMICILSEVSMREGDPFGSFALPLACAGAPGKVSLEDMLDMVVVKMDYWRDI